MIGFIIEPIPECVEHRPAVAIGNRRQESYRSIWNERRHDPRDGTDAHNITFTTRFDARFFQQICKRLCLLIEFSTAFFSSTIGGAAEMANLSDRYGGRVSLVASAHSLRILLVVVLVPLGFRLSGVTGIGLFAPATQVIDPAGLAILFALGGCGALLARRSQIPNAWVLGPMAVTIFLTSQDMALSAMPSFLLNGAQLLIGWSLGDRYTPDFFRTAPRFMALILVYTLIAIALSVGLSMALAPATGISSPTLILGLAPGGVAEMCITAKVLQLGVPLVTAFQVFRLAAVLLVSAPLYRVLLKRFPALRE